VTDLGENRWLYHYQGKGLLGKVIDPLGQIAAKFSYGIAGKVTSAKVRAQKNTFKQQGSTTVAKNAKSQQVTFVHNAAGIVTSVTNADGLTSRIELNRQRQPIELWHNNKKQAQFDYDINGDLIRVEQVKVEYRYQYNAFGRIVLTSGSDGTTTAYKYDAKGNLLKDISPKLEKTYRYANNGDLVSETEYFTGLAINTTYYEYNADGLLSKLVSGELQTRFFYSATGRLAQVTFPDGAIHQYEHDKLGFRVRTKRSDKSQVKYDTVGNLRESIKLNDGQLTNEGKSNTLKLNSANQVIEIKTTDQPPMKVVYSALGHPVQINKGEKQINYGYDSSGRLTQVDDSQSGVSQYTYETNEQGLRAQFDTRTSRTKSPQSQLTHHNQSQSQLLYTHMIGSPWQAVTWSDSQAKLLVVEPSQFGAANAGFESAKQRQRLFDAKSTLKQGQLNFDKPSNAMFPAL
jgi:YD repeat-containing protein